MEEFNFPSDEDHSDEDLDISDEDVNIDSESEILITQWQPATLQEGKNNVMSA